MSIFKKMVELQHNFNKQAAGDDYLDKNLPWNSAIIAESGELLESYGYKWWKKQEPDMANVNVEAIDLLHFVISEKIQEIHCPGSGIPFSLDEVADRFEKYFYEADNINGQLDIPFIIDMLNYKGYDRFLVLKSLFLKLDMSNEDIYIAYIVKNCLNKFRQDNGYKDGTYIKIWNGREDNIVAYELAKAIGISTDLFELLYKNLETYYKEDN